MNPREARERAEQIRADAIENRRAWKSYEEEQEALREYEALSDLGGFIPLRDEDPFDDYAAWQGMASSYEDLRR